MLDPARLQSLLDGIPAYERFPTIDEVNERLQQIADRFPDIARLRRIGTSRLGEPIRILSIGEEPPHALIVGGPHPNEPIGLVTVIELAQLLCENTSVRKELGYSWHFIGCIDPDGARLNEGWYASPGDRHRYARHFFRPALRDQVEWTFPCMHERWYFDRCLPETEALRRMIDELRPALLYSLHNFEYGGVYFYVTRPDLDLARRLTDVAGMQDLPLHLGEPEIPGTRPIAPAVYEMPTVESLAALVERHGIPPGAIIQGMSSLEYAGRHGTLGLVAELPYWKDPRFQDQRPGTQSYSSALSSSLRERRELRDTIEGILGAVEADLTVDSPFRRSVLDSLAMASVALPLMEKIAAQSEHSNRVATVAETCSLRDAIHIVRLRIGGQLLRMLEGEIAVGNATPAIRDRARVLRGNLDSWCEQANEELSTEPIEIRRLVAVQIAAGLTAADHLRQLEFRTE
jgi:hypothetical protein